MWVKKPDHFFGLQTVRFGINKVEIADPGRLLIDILDKPDFGGVGVILWMSFENIGSQKNQMLNNFLNMQLGIKKEL